MGKKYSDKIGHVQGGMAIDRNIQSMKSKDLQPRLLYPAKLSFKIKGQIKSFPDKNKLKEFFTTKPVLNEMLKGLFLFLYFTAIPFKEASLRRRK